MRITKILSALAATAIIVATTSALSTSAKPVSTRNNVGNKTKYNKVADYSLKKKFFDDGPFNKEFYTRHDVVYDGDGNAWCMPYNGLGKTNRVYWYSEVRKNNGKGKISHYYEKTKSVDNYDKIDYDLSDGMFFAWDDDVTYFRYDIWPSTGGKSTVSSEEFKFYNRRASTDVYDD